MPSPHRTRTPRTKKPSRFIDNQFSFPFPSFPFLVLVVLLGLTRCDEGWTCSGLGALTFDLLSRFVNISCLAQSVLSTFLLSILVFSFIVVFYSVNIFSLYCFFSLQKSAQQKCREQPQQRTTSGPPAAAPSFISLLCSALKYISCFPFVAFPLIAIEQKCVGCFIDIDPSICPMQSRYSSHPAPPSDHVIKQGMLTIDCISCPMYRQHIFVPTHQLNPSKWNETFVYSLASTK